MDRLHLSRHISMIKDLSLLPIADRTTFPVETYFDYPEIANLRYPEKSRRFTQMTVSRGCSTGCTFCKVKHLRRKYRWRDIDHVIHEIRFLTIEKGIEEIHFLDENLFLNKPRAKQFLKRIIDERLAFYWFCGGGMAVYILDEELLQMMKRSGCYRLHLAIESGSQRILTDIMKKPIHLSKILKLLTQAKKLDFEMIGYFMIGLPTEKMTEIYETIELAKNEVFDYVVFSIYTPEKGTLLYDFCIDNNLIDESQSLLDLSKRAASNIRSEAYDTEFLMKIRNNVYQEINFKNPIRRKKIEMMFGSLEND